MKRHFKGSILAYDPELETDVYIDYHGYHIPERIGKSHDSCVQSETSITFTNLPSYMEHLEDSLKEEVIFTEEL